jgi:hypothetical protein
MITTHITLHYYLFHTEGQSHSFIEYSLLGISPASGYYYNYKLTFWNSVSVPSSWVGTYPADYTLYSTLYTHTTAKV